MCTVKKKKRQKGMAHIAQQGLPCLLYLPAVGRADHRDASSAVQYVQLLYSCCTVAGLDGPLHTARYRHAVQGETFSIRRNPEIS